MHPAPQPLLHRLLARAGPWLRTFTAASLLVVAAHGHADGAGTAAAADEVPADILAALAARSPASVQRARDLEDRRIERDRVVRGVGFAASAKPTLDLEQDLSDPNDHGTWDADLLLEATFTYRYDAVATLDAEVRLERAAARLRAQRRADVEQALLDLSRLRIAERSLQAARQERDASLEDASADPDDPALARALDRAELEVDELLLDVETLAWELTQLGIRPTGAWRPFAFELPVVTQGRHPRALALGLEVALAEARRERASTSVLDEIELTATYETAGARALGSVGWDAGRPQASVTVRWRPGDARGWGVGVSARLQVDDATTATLARAERDLHDAEAALASFVEAFGRSVEASARRVDIAWRDVTYAERDLADTRRARDESPTSGSRAELAVRRAEDALDRAWQGYVRAVADHLELLDAAWPTPGSGARDVEDV